MHFTFCAPTVFGNGMAYFGVQIGCGQGDGPLLAQSGHAELHRTCPLLAQSGHAELHRTCPLSGVKRTCLFALQMSAFDPKRTKLAATNVCLFGE
jgi:hypothetical protein